MMMLPKIRADHASRYIYGSGAEPHTVNPTDILATAAAGIPAALAAGV